MHCVKSKNGWCVVDGYTEPKEGDTVVATLCGHCIVLPYGFADREPTCPDCLTVLCFLDKETGIPCFVCGKNSGIDCPGRKPNEATRCRKCLDEYMDSIRD